MSLHRNATEFAERVRSAPISGNIDNPEGGLDALMQESFILLRQHYVEKSKDGILLLRQHNVVKIIICCKTTFIEKTTFQVIVCKKLVGWREDARRVIIYTTDQVLIIISHFYPRKNHSSIT